MPGLHSGESFPSPVATTRAARQGWTPPPHPHSLIVANYSSFLSLHPTPPSGKERLVVWGGKGEKKSPPFIIHGSAKSSSPPPCQILSVHQSNYPELCTQIFFVLGWGLVSAGSSERRGPQTNLSAVIQQLSHPSLHSATMSHIWVWALRLGGISKILIHTVLFYTR